MSRLQTSLVLATGVGLLVFALPTRRGSNEAVDAGPLGSVGLDVAEGPATATEPPVGPGKRIERQRRRRASSAWGRDPFEDPAPPVTPDAGRGGSQGKPVPRAAVPEPRPPAVVPSMRLTGISRSGKKRWAIIDREIVQEGDALPSGHRISRIDEHTVTVMIDREAVVLSMGSKR